MANSLLQHYVKLTEILGQALGPDYEVALHDLTDKNRSIIAIANNHVSGREVGAPLTNVALQILMDKSYETQDYRLHYCGVSAEGKALRSSTLFIKQNGKLIGMLCINFDDSRYQSLSKNIMQLCHPDNFVDENFSFSDARTVSTEAAPAPAHARRAHSDHRLARIRRYLPAQGRGQGCVGRVALLAGERIPLSLPNQKRRRITRLRFPPAKNERSALIFHYIQEKWRFFPCCSR